MTEESNKHYVGHLLGNKHDYPERQLMIYKKLVNNIRHTCFVLYLMLVVVREKPVKKNRFDDITLINI